MPSRRAHMLLCGLAATLVLIVAGVMVPRAGAGAAPGDRVLQMYQDYRDRSFPEVPDLPAAGAGVWADSTDAIWLDVRTSRERRVSLIEGAIDRASFEAQREQLAGRPVIVYCTVGYRSGLVTRALRGEGAEAFNLAGGVLAWIHAGGSLVDGIEGEATRRVHVYGRRWNLVPEGWRAVW